MRRTLILMRHAKSSWDTPGPDHDRPLNGRGRKSARAMGRWIKSLGYMPDRALCSTARRTMETFERSGITCPISFTRALYHAEPEAMLSVLSEATEPTILMIGHNPGIAEFAEMLVKNPPDHPRFFDFPTCATMIATFDIPDWDSLTGGSGETTQFAIPREVLDQS